MRLKLPLFILTFLFINVLTIDTTILKHLTKQDQKNLFIAGEFMNILESQRYFNKQKFTCLTLVPTNITTQKKQFIEKLNLTFSYNNNNKDRSVLETIRPSEQQQQQSKKQQQQNIIGYRYEHDYDKILDLLHGTCVIHETNQFLYEYCHKEKVRQFDDLYTRQRMAKAQFQDIAMGYYNYQSALQQSTSEHNKGLKPGKAMYQIKYSENGDLTILTKLLQNVPQLTVQQKQILKQTIVEKSNIENVDSKNNNQQPSTTTTTNTNQIIKIKPLPTKSVIYDKKNLFTVQTVNHHQYQLNKRTKIINLNYPIVKSNKYFTKAQLIYQVICVGKNVNNNVGNNIKGQPHQGVYVAKGVVVSTFQLLFLGDVQKCDSIKSIGYRPLQQKPYNENQLFYSNNKMRVIDDIAYGYVEQFCTNNWDWQFTKKNTSPIEKQPTKNSNNHYLQPGTTLWLQVAMNSTTTGGRVTYHHFPITVKQVITQGVIKMQEEILLNVPIKSSKDVVWVNSCKVISKRPLNRKFHTVQNQIIRKNVIKIKQLPSMPSSKKSGDQVLCLCRFRKYSQHFLQMHLTFGKKLFPSNKQTNYFSYFEFYQSQRTVKTTQQQNDQQLYTLCNGGLMCFDYDVEKQKQKTVDKKDNNIKRKSQGQKLQQTQQQKGFTTITKLTPFTQPLQFTQQSIKKLNNIIILHLSEHSIIKLHTITTENEHYTYIITPTKIIKYSIFDNGTKQIYQENSYYQNQTISQYYYASWFSSTIYVHGRYIWRAGDRLVFPRILMGSQQKIVKIQSVMGCGYVRLWDVDEMKYQQKSNMVTGVEQMFDRHYYMKKVALYQDQTKDKDKGNVQQKQPLSLTQQQQQSPSTQKQFSSQQHPTTATPTTPYPKRLTRSISLRYQYFHGDYCTPPINKYRHTNVILQCGQPWMKIQQVRQTSPCVYEMIVSTKLLCRQGYKKRVDKLESMINSGNVNMNSNGNRISMQKRIVCYPSDTWDDVLYVYDIKEKDVEYKVK